jgi:2,4-dienoyl-CoA reductase-like NADH-dependent reductase (Old Yellow Enzyme family)
MARLFERTSINGMELENRFVRSATWEGMATDDGICTPRLIDLLVELASGGVGLIISSHTYVSRAGQAGPWQLGIDWDELTPGLQDMTEAVHRENGKIVLQLAHAGCRAIPELTGQEPAGPSGSKSEADAPYRQMSIDDIRATIEAFASGAARAKASGFDGATAICSASSCLLTTIKERMPTEAHSQTGHGWLSKYCKPFVTKSVPNTRC